MVTGNVQLKHKRYYAVLNFYNGTKRKPKWIATGLGERGNKKEAKRIATSLTHLFNRDGTLIDKYTLSYNSLSNIKIEISLPDITFRSLCKHLGLKNKVQKPELQNAVIYANSAPVFKHENDIVDMYFCDYMILWLERLSPNISKNTFASYKRCVHGRVYEYFKTAEVTVGELQPNHIEAFYQLLSCEGLSPNSIIHYHNNIRKALQQLYTKQIIPYNPADLISNRPIRMIYPATVLNEKQLNDYLQIVRGTKMELPVLGAAFYGFRRSEILGLKNSAVDMEKRTISIRHTVSPASIDGKLEIIKNDRTKTQCSQRTMPLVHIMENAIKDSIEQQMFYKKKYGRLYSTADEDYLCKDEYGRLLKPDYISNTHVELLKKNNLPVIRFHDLRHSCATLLISKNVPLEKIKEWLGHADIKTTEKYAHMNISAAKGEMAVIMSETIKY